MVPGHHFIVMCAVLQLHRPGKESSSLHQRLHGEVACEKRSCKGQDRSLQGQTDVFRGVLLRAGPFGHGKRCYCH